MAKIRPASHPDTNKVVFSIITEQPIANKKILDIGAGRGYMSQMIGDQCHKENTEPSRVLTACDLFPENFEYSEIVCDKMQFVSKLPYSDNSFDIILLVNV